MFVPLRLAERMVGVFTIQSYTKQAYCEKDLHLLQALADLSAGALDRIRVKLPASATGKAKAGRGVGKRGGGK